LFRGWNRSGKVTKLAIEKRGNQWYYRFTLRGKEYRNPTGLGATPQNRREAEAIEARAKLEILAGVKASAASEPANFAVAADDFLKWCFSTEYRSKPNTARRIQISFQSMLAKWENKAVSDIDVNAIEDYKTWRLTEHGVRDVTLRHDLHALSVFFNKYAIRKKLAASNPVDQVSKPSDKDAVRIHIVTHDEEVAYFSHARGTLHDVARLILLQGCRPEEILSLRPEHIDFASETLRITGGKTRAARRDLPMTGETMRLLENRIARQSGAKWLFPSSRLEGGHVTKLNAQHDRVCREAEVSFCLYDMRHTWATRAITEAKMDVATVAALMGHATPTIVLKHYVHPTAEGKRKSMNDYEAAIRPKLRMVK
jgi:integrase